MDKDKNKDLYFDENYFLGMTDEEVSRDKKYFVLIIYDISDNKRRNKMVKVLEGYAIRVQKSAFEAFLRPNKYQKLLLDIENIPDTTDTVRVYKIQGKGSVENFGQQFTLTDEEVIII